MLGWIIGLTAIGALALGLLYFGIWWGGRTATVIDDEPTEHGDGVSTPDEVKRWIDLLEDREP